MHSSCDRFGIKFDEGGGGGGISLKCQPSSFPYPPEEERTADSSY